MGWMADETGLEKTAANHVALTPLSFLRRARDVYPDQTAVIWGPHRKTYAEYYERVTRLASALVGLGVKPGDVVVMTGGGRGVTAWTAHVLATHVQPTLAERAEYPQRLLVLGLSGLFLVLLWAILVLTGYALRDRR